eukprot:scaffold85895_cov77-Cyclotella_meneghiniana.AAC.3
MSSVEPVYRPILESLLKPETAHTQDHHQWHNLLKSKLQFRLDCMNYSLVYFIAAAKAHSVVAEFHLERCTENILIPMLSLKLFWITRQRQKLDLKINTAMSESQRTEWYAAKCHMSYDMSLRVTKT